MSTASGSSRAAEQPALIHEGPSSKRVRPSSEEGRISAEHGRAEAQSAVRLAPVYVRDLRTSGVRDAESPTGVGRATWMRRGGHADASGGLVGYVASLMLALPVALVTAVILMLVPLDDE